MFSSFLVLFCEIFPASLLQQLPPILVCTVPLSHPPQAILKINSRLPAKLLFDFCGIHGVARIVAWAVFHELDLVLPHSHQRTNFLRNFNVRKLLAFAADTVGLPGFSFGENRVNSPAVILHVPPAARARRRALVPPRPPPAAGPPFSPRGAPGCRRGGAPPPGPAAGVGGPGATRRNARGRDWLH